MSDNAVPVDGVSVAARLHRPAEAGSGLPLLVAVHGGAFTGAYFQVAGSGVGSFVDVATRNGFPVLLVDRPGYGSSDALPDDENTYARHAELLDGAIAEVLPRSGADSVVVVGHSIGGMVAVEIAARHPSWSLVGICVSGLGAQPTSNPAHQIFGTLPIGISLELPEEQWRPLMFGPDGTWTDEAREAAWRTSYSPAPSVDLVNAGAWHTARLPATAPEVTVPVQYKVAEFDALWDGSEKGRAVFTDQLVKSPRVTSDVVRNVGHCIDHHRVAAAFQLAQLGFALECAETAGRA